MWTAYLFQTTTGMIGPQLQFESMDWSVELNGTEEINMRLRKSELPKVDLKYWLSPWWAGVVIFWNNEPIVAGPIITRPSESFDFVTIGCGGIRSLLAKRLVAPDLSRTGWADFNKSVASWSGLSLGTIVKRVVAYVQTKTAGKLPITYANGDMTGIHERNYKGFNISNINADDVLTKLSNVINGPDIMFKPRLLRADVLTFDLWTGTDAQPRIYQKNTPVWDTTAENGFVSNMNVVTTGTYQTNRVYSSGAGQDEGTLLKVATDTRPLERQYPLLETTISEGSSENPDVVMGHAVAELEANVESLMEIQMTVRIDGPIPIGQFWPGDLVEVYTKGWLALDDGRTQMRLLSITGDHTNNVKISLQKEEKFT
jgi:hypothetical protein